MNKNKKNSFLESTRIVAIAIFIFSFCVVVAKCMSYDQEHDRTEEQQIERK